MRSASQSCRRQRWSTSPNREKRFLRKERLCGSCSSRWLLAFAFGCRSFAVRRESLLHGAPFHFSRSQGFVFFFLQIPGFPSFRSLSPLSLLSSPASLPSRSAYSHQSQPLLNPTPSLRPRLSFIILLARYFKAFQRVLPTIFDISRLRFSISLLLSSCKSIPVPKNIGAIYFNQTLYTIAFLLRKSRIESFYLLSTLALS